LEILIFERKKILCFAKIGNTLFFWEFLKLTKSARIWQSLHLGNISTLMFLSISQTEVSGKIIVILGKTQKLVYLSVV